MSAPFDEVRFPERISRGATLGPSFRTDVLTNSAGYEIRNQESPLSPGVYNVSTGIKNKTDFDEVLAFFRARRGRLRGFRFKNWLDYQAGTNGILVNLTTTTWQLYKRYPDTALPYDRKIQKPVSGTVVVAGSGTYTYSTITGIVTKTGGSDPTGTWTGEFDEVCRFDVDQLQASVTMVEAIEWPNVVIVEYPIP